MDWWHKSKHKRSVSYLKNCLADFYAHSVNLNFYSMKAAKVYGNIAVYGKKCGVWKYCTVSL